MLNLSPVKAALAALSFAAFLVAGTLTGCAQSTISQSSLDHEFLEAVARNDAVAAKHWLDKGANIEAKNHNDYTALLVIAHREHALEEQNKATTALIQLLLERGANTEVTDLNGSTPLLVAAESDDPAMVKLLLDKGAHAEAANHSNETALMAASSTDALDVVEILLAKTRDSKEKDRALFAAIQTAPAVKMSPMPVSRPTSATAPFPVPDGSQTVKLLLEKGADIEARDEQDQTPLIRAASYGQAGIVKVLLDKGAYMEAQDQYGNTALISAACGGCIGIDMGDTIACERVLLERGANMKARNSGGQTALLVAATFGQTEIVKLLLNKGANLADRDRDGNTALILAASGDILTATGMVFTADTVKFLLGHHADVNAKNKKGQTALIAAVAEKDDAHEAGKIVRLLLAHGVDTGAKDNHGNTALTLARRNGYEDVVRLLQKPSLNPQ